ncbi:hypothetical protein [Roseimaritima ulvae]|uniref:Uncharacterized protein n=1 Tax=Roseimaritima ulvae TaxID=980254 RepID=A0A5B9QRX2_9BACT|nr:hypothetical protein [Roseimaritima ulvae]QEG40450.1 hypothetical protein UC8_24620 [Roseimaritima ulvae]
MNQTEFDDWLNFHSAAFPTIGRWIEGIDETETFLGLWKKALASVSLDDARSITEAMAMGDIDAPLEWEQRDQTAIIIRREAARLRGVRRKRESVATSRPMPSRHGGMFTPLRALLTRVQALGTSLRNGKLSKEDHDLQLEQVFHEAKKGGNDQRRVRCNECSDSGLIICWHSFSVSVLRNTEKLERSKWATMAVACGGCEAGRVHWLPEAEGGRQNPSLRYDARIHCRLVSGCGVPIESDFAELKRWLAEDYLCPAMSGEFAAFNAGE